METNTIENPFTNCTARDMTYEEISKYWCSPFKLYHINEVELMRSRTPIIIEGARGTGKTMLLKHLSYHIQKDNVRGKELNTKLAFFKKKCIGVYFRYKEDFCNMFKTLNCTFEERRSIFSCYYEMYISRQIVEILCDIYIDNKNDINEVRCAHAIGDIIHVDVDSFKKLYDAFNNKISCIDNAINYSIYNPDWLKDIQGLIQLNNIVRRTVYTISRLLEGWETIQFNVLLDEYENARSYQKVMNTFLKQVDDTVNLSYRIGMRPEGMFDNSTNLGEKLQIDRDFILQRLNCMAERNEYRKFAIDVAKKRLESVEYFKKNNLTDINVLLGPKENIDCEAGELAKSRYQFELIRKNFQHDEMDRVIETLSCEEKLMEMYNILSVSRGRDYEDVGRCCKEYIKLRDSNDGSLKTATGELRKYYNDYSNKYRMAMLYLLLAIYKKHKKYYSLNTFLYLSSGSINDFISLCRNTFYLIDSSVMDDIQSGKPISSKIQTEAAIRTANNQLKKIEMSNEYGKEMGCFIDNMGRMFADYNKDLAARYPETNQFAFDDENSIYQDEELNPYIVELINSGAIIKPDKKQNISMSKEKGYVYKLNRIFAPIYEFSYRSRGGFNVRITRNEFKEALNKKVTLYKSAEAEKNKGQLWLAEYMNKE